MFLNLISKNKRMEVEKIIHYLLIGNLYSGKVIYEQSNIIDPKTIYEANLIFTNYQKKKVHSLNTQIDLFTISIFADNIIMIIKADDLFPMERSLELFKKIKKSNPDLYELSADFNLNLYKQSLSEKILKVIHEYFNEINGSRKMQNNINYRKHDVNDIIEEESDESKKDSSIYSKNSRKAKKSSLNSHTMDVDNFSFNSIKLDKTIYTKKNQSKILKKGGGGGTKISVKLIDDNEEENKTNMYRALIQSSSLVKINNNNDINRSKNRWNESHMTNKYAEDLKNIVWKITCCKKVIIFFIILVIIIQVVVIPIIIKFSYSY